MMGGILLLNVLFITLFYKELKLATFDAELAATLGFAPAADPLRADDAGLGHGRGRVRRGGLDPGRGA